MFLYHFEGFLGKVLAVKISVLHHFLDRTFTLELIAWGHLAVKLRDALANVEADIGHGIFSQLQNHVHELLVEDVFLQFGCQPDDEVNGLNSDHESFVFREFMHLLVDNSN